MLLQSPPEGEAAAEAFNAGEVIIEHVSNTSLDHPLIHLPSLFGINMSVTKHVFMLWVVSGLLFVGLTWVVRRYLRQERMVPTGAMTLVEMAVEFVRDSIVEPNLGKTRVRGWTPLLLTLFLFILGANLIGIIPIFDALSLANHGLIHASEDSFFAQVLHGGVTVTGNFNVTAALATVSFVAIIVAGSQVHGAWGHWKNMVPSGLPLPVTIMLIPIELMGTFVRPFALTMRLAANMTGGHISILVIVSFVFIFAEMAGQAVGMGVGAFLSVPLAVALSALELIVIGVQAYVFTLLTAVFIGMAIHAHH